MSAKRVLVITAPQTAALTEALAVQLRGVGVSVLVDAGVDREPTIGLFRQMLAKARSHNPDAVIGIGGGSALDVAKLIAAFARSEQDICEAFGINLLRPRPVFLACLPTTAGTGSEVSPNAILLDEGERLKKGVVSPFLMPDATYIDPLLTVSMPPGVTAGTGLDALTHSIEAYTNVFAHPIADLYALEGIRLVGRSLARAVKDGNDLEARDGMAAASMYGGMVLGPVNTAAVHALSYPLSGEFHIAHGIANAVLLPHVMEFNCVAAPERYAQVALALGAQEAGDAAATALRGIERVRNLMKKCGVPLRLSEMSIPADSIPAMAEAAMKVTRLLGNNPRVVSRADAEEIYRRAY